MSELTYGERQWMLGYISDGLRKLGQPVTPAAVERELRHMDALRTASDAPPDPYRAALEKQRAADGTTAGRATPLPSGGLALDLNGIPDPYKAALDRLRSEKQ
jgi:hypothetical protein